LNIDRTHLTLNIDRLPYDDDLLLEQLTHRLRREIEDIDNPHLEKVEVIKSGKAPDGTRAGGDIPVWGSSSLMLNKRR